MSKHRGTKRTNDFINDNDRNPNERNPNDRKPIFIKKTRIIKPKHNDENDDLDLFIRLLSGAPPQDNLKIVEQPLPKLDDLCKNPMCNHKTFEDDDTQADIFKKDSIENMYDLIELGKSFHCKKNTEYSGMNLRIMFNLIEPLTELSRMVGMSNVKEHIVDQILFFLQGSHIKSKCGKCNDCLFGLKCLNSQTDMLHTVITGPPGVGKTELGKILGKVYKEMGILSKGTFKLVSRSDLIAGYLGQTAIKTQKVINEAQGGVLFIDEAYSLGNSELRDSFSKECLDTLNQNLSEKRDFLCIIAGYQEQLEKCFFKYNEGLRRRFTFRYNIKQYNASELLEIFEKKVLESEWSLYYNSKPDDTSKVLSKKARVKNSVEELFKKNMNKFPNFGGDMETLLLKCKIVNTRRCSFNEGESRKTLSFDDIRKGIELFSKHRASDLAYNSNSDSDSDGGKISIYS